MQRTTLIGGTTAGPSTSSSTTMPMRPKPQTRSGLVEASERASRASPAIPRAFTKTTSGDLEVPETECWEKFLSQPRKHLLFCGHEYDTTNPEPCGSSCKPSKVAESKARLGRFQCRKGYCETVRKREANFSIFIPKKPVQRKLPVGGPLGGAAKMLKGGNRGLFTADHTMDSNVEESVAGRSGKQSMEATAFTSTVEKEVFVEEVGEDEAELKRLNAECKADPALAALVATQTGMGMRRLSKLHAGYALRAEREAEDQLAAMTKGVTVLRPLSNPRRAVENPKFSMPDRPIEENLADRGTQATPPSPMKNAKTRLQCRLALGIEEDSDNDVKREFHETGVIEESDDESAVHGVRGLRSDGTFFEEESYCALCGMSSNECLEECKGCDRLFHPSCLAVKIVERCTECKERRQAHEDLAEKMFAKRVKSVKVSTIAEIRAANIMRRNTRKEEMERASFKNAIKGRIQKKKADTAGEDAEHHAQDATDTDLMDVE